MRPSLSWILWTLSGMAWLLSTRNPWVLLPMLLALFILGLGLTERGNYWYWLKGNCGFLFFILLMSSLVNTAFTHTGDTVLLFIPKNIPLIGGAITLESLIYGLINGLVIGSIYLLFSLLNKALSIQQITRLIPRMFQPIAMTISIALTFVPSIQQRVGEIKEAQQIRGNPMKRLVDWIPIFIPLLVSSLENAVLLSESLTTRGFHSSLPARTATLTLIGMIAAIFAIFSGWILELYNYPDWFSFGLFALGSLLLLLVFLFSDRKGKTTRYHEIIWQSRDIFFTLVCSISLIIFASLSINNKLALLDYSPYLQLTLPAPNLFSLVIFFFTLSPTLIIDYD